ncbi:MAG: hypothetical protein JO192_02610 [Candidatus Eremiobacteraeota bacterium]|nr:hypothetical protein [Candidatus Eremiobacteraeota bacterium]
MSVSNSNLPVPMHAAALVMRELPASSLLVESDGNRLGGELRRLRGWRARYSLALANDSPLHVMVTLRARRGDIERRLPPGEFWIDPQSHADLTIDVPTHVAYAGGSLVVRLVNAQIHEMVAPLPGPAGIFGALLGGFAVAAVAAGFVFATPRIDVFAVPPIGVSNSLLRVPYRTAGLGSSAYALIDDRGVTVRSGDVRKRAGTLAFTLPSAQRTQSYILQMRETGPLGEAERAEPVTALPEPAPPMTGAASALIDSLAIDSWQIPDGGVVTVRYRTSARSGVVSIKDAQNTVWASDKISPDGVTQLRIPHFGHDKELRVALAVARGDVHAASSLGVQVVAAPKPAPAPAAVLAAAVPVAVAPQAAAPPRDDPPAQTPPPVEQQHVNVVGTNVAGFTVRTSIVPGATNVRLALETADGQTIASEYVQDGATTASVDAPPGTHGRIVLIATYDLGQGQESTVKTIDIP